MGSVNCHQEVRVNDLTGSQSWNLLSNLDKIGEESRIMKLSCDFICLYYAIIFFHTYYLEYI